MQELADGLENTPFPDDEPMTMIDGAIKAAAIEASISVGHQIHDAISRTLYGEESSSGA